MEHSSRPRNRSGSPHGAAEEGHASGGARKHYIRFFATLGVSLVVMYSLAFSQIDTFSEFYPSLSVLWITISMVSAMGIIMLVGMRGMLSNRRANLVLFAVFAAILVGAFTAGRYEAGVGDDAFLRSMIPHHSRAIHMCQQADLQDPEVVRLCGQIIEAQRSEISQMEQIIARRG